MEMGCEKMTGLTSWDSTAINAWIHVPGAPTQLKIVLTFILTKGS